MKWILRYIKGSIDVGLVFEKDTAGNKECLEMSIPLRWRPGQPPVYNGVCVHIIPSMGKLTLYSTVYCRFVYYGGQVYGNDGGYEGDDLASRIA